MIANHAELSNGAIAARNATSSGGHYQQAEDGGIITVLWLNTVFLMCGLLVYFALRPKVRAFYAPRTDYASRGLSDEEPILSFAGYGRRHPWDLWDGFKAVATKGDADILHNNGLEPMLFLRYTRFVCYYIVIVAFFSLVVLLPINLTGGESEFGGPRGFGQTAASNIDEGSSKFWAHAIMMTFFSGFGLFYLYCLQSHYFRARDSYQPYHSVQSRTIYAKGLSRRNFATNEDLYRFFDAHYPSKVVAAHLVVNMEPLQKLEKKREKLLAKLERANAKFRTKGKRPKVMTFAEGSIDAIERYTRDLETMDDKLVQAAQFQYPPTGNAFVTFVDKKTRDRCLRDYLRARKPRHIRAILSVARSSGHAVSSAAHRLRINNIQLRGNSGDSSRRSDGNEPHWVGEEQEDSEVIRAMRDQALLGAKFRLKHPPPPSDLFWEHMKYADNPVFRNSRKVMGWAVLLALAFFWSVPVSFFASLSNLTVIPGIGDALEWVLDLDSTLRGFLENYVPTALVYLLNLSLTPVIKRIAMSERPHSLSRLDMMLMQKHFVFVLFNTLIFPTIFIGSLDVIEKVFNSDSPSGALWNAIRSVDFTATGAFYIGLFLQAALLGTVFELVRPRYLLKRLVKTHARTFYTQREWDEVNALERIKVGSSYARLLLIFCIVLSYAPIVPLVTVAGILNIVSLYFTEKTNLLLVYLKESGGEGLLISSVTKLFIGGMLTSQILIAGFLSVKAPQTLPLTLCVMALTALSFVFFTYRYYYRSKMIEGLSTIDDSDEIVGEEDQMEKGKEKVAPKYGRRAALEVPHDKQRKIEKSILYGYLNPAVKYLVKSSGVSEEDTADRRRNLIPKLKAEEDAWQYFDPDLLGEETDIDLSPDQEEEEEGASGDDFGDVHDFQEKERGQTTGGDF